MRRVVPEDFELQGLPEFVQVNAIALTCQRVIVNTTVLHNVSMMETVVFATPKEPSWRGSGLNFWVLDTWYDSPELAQWLKPIGYPADHATIERTNLPSPSGPHVQDWRVAGTNCETKLNFQGHSAATSPSSGKATRWFGTKPYGRTDASESYVWDAYTASVLTMEGQCKSNEVFGGSTTYIQEVLRDFNSTWTITGTKFG